MCVHIYYISTYDISSKKRKRPISIYYLVIARFSSVQNVLKVFLPSQTIICIYSSFAIVAIGKSNTGAFTTRQKRRQWDHSDPSARRRMYVLTQHRYASSIGDGNNLATGDRGRVRRYHQDQGRTFGLR